MQIIRWIFLFTMVVTWIENVTMRRYSRERILELREKVRGMFQHAYDGYLQYASGYDELRPLTCDGVDTWGSYSLTLIDALDTLATMGNFTEFRRVAKLLEEKMDFDKDINVSVFETNIRIVGGLIGAHLMSKRAGVDVEPGWPCAGPLLRMAEDVAHRLLPAFDTATGMPYGTVNLRYGVPRGETPITCTAGVGTFLIEFGALSRLTGNSIFEDVALNAVYALWERRSLIGLFGNHIDVQTGRWTALDAGIGAGVDSFYEYLVKGALLLNRPNLLEMFHEARRAIDKYLKHDDWYVWATMTKGQVTLPIFQSLEAYWPGVLSMIGDIEPAFKTLAKYNAVWKKYGFLPEFYNIPAGHPTTNRESYPLRPELAESAMYLYRTTKNPILLQLGENMIHSIEVSAKTTCGYATISNVLTHEKLNRMESFFLAETTKYLYLLFDEDNLLHHQSSQGEIVETPHGQCLIHTGPFIFNTEAHPVDMSALSCCRKSYVDEYQFDDSHGDQDDADTQEQEYDMTNNCEKYQPDSPPYYEPQNKNKKDSEMSIDVEVFNEKESPEADELIKNVEDVQDETDSGETSEISIQPLPLTVSDLTDFFNSKRENFSGASEVLESVVKFMKNFSLDPEQIRALEIFERRHIANHESAEKDYEGRSVTLWELFKLKNKYKINSKLVKELGILTMEEDENQQVLDDVAQALQVYADPETEPMTDIEKTVFAAGASFQKALVNTTAMQEFLLKILINGSEDKRRSYTELLTNDEILLLTSESMDSNLVLDRGIFENLNRIVRLKLRLIQTFKKLQTAMAGGKIPEPEVIDRRSDKGIAPIASESNSKEENTCEGTDSPAQTKKNDDQQSLWSQLVETILRTTNSLHRTKFDEKSLLKKTRKSLKKYENIPLNYSVFHCPALNYFTVFLC